MSRRDSEDAVTATPRVANNSATSSGMLMSDFSAMRAIRKSRCGASLP